jgi:hypothetical protein
MAAGHHRREQDQIGTLEAGKLATSFCSTEIRSKEFRAC